MRYQNVCIESFGYTLPTEIVTSDQLEARLAPLYERLRLPPGRLELMTVLVLFMPSFWENIGSARGQSGRRVVKRRDAPAELLPPPPGTV